MLTKRLDYLVEAIPECDVLSDVGCDHGYVGIEALKRGRARQVVFADISPACLQKARSNCPTAFKDVTSFVCQDGLGQIACDVALICGMGGLEILSILKGARQLPKAVVLQPMRNIVDTRIFVAEHYDLTLDVTVYDGKFYSVMVGESLGSPTRRMTELEREFGLTNINSPNEDFVQYLLNEQQKLQSILSGCNAVDVSKRLENVCKALEVIRRKI